jgi:predicted small metal-binding protein
VRVIHCDCGQTLQAANDDDLVHVIQGHLTNDHPEEQMSDEEIRALIGSQAYEATDA